ncbi:MAG: pyridoxal phosphate-dependent aminotransferase [Candidatus Omnitrophica bacterium]|nr:pyridoxal phosphate-dependent aminotransferase [Candidatus Omnitrophota bacterium]
MTLALADRLRHVEGSPTLALAAKAKALAKAGKPVLDFTAGEPDFPTPAHVKQAGIQAIEANHTRYTPVAGILELRKAIANNLAHRLGLKYADAEVMVSCGAKQALYNALQVLCDPEDEVIILTPYWVSYDPLVRLASATPVFVETKEADGFQPDPAAVKRAITSKTKAIILNSPSNPTGAVIEESRLKELAAVVKGARSDDSLLIISDEIYDQIVFPPARVRSIVQVDPTLIDRTILVNGVSKSYSMTGWRIGYAAGPKNVIDAMINLQSHSTSNPASISQYAALQALTGDQQDVQRMVAEFQRRRDRLVNGLNQLKPLRCTMPGGAFYAWCNVSGLGQSADATAAQWLEDALVATVPGEGFGAPGYIRLSFATSLEQIEEALTRLGQWMRTRKPAGAVRSVERG